MKVATSDHKTYTKKVPHYIDLLSFETSPNFMRAKMIIMDVGYGYSIDLCSVLLIDWQHNVCSD